VEALKVVCVGGGLGAPTVMAGLRSHTDDITGLIAVTDSGRSTGKVRIALDVPAPGDIRNALVVLSEGDAVLRALMSHRFQTDKSEELDGMAVLTALRERVPDVPVVMMSGRAGLSDAVRASASIPGARCMASRASRQSRS